MLSDLRLFVKERFPLPVSLPLTIVLFGGPACLSPLGLWGALLGWASTFLALLCLRIADDLTSVEFDQFAHPERGLPSGRINAANLKILVAVGLVILMALHINSPAFFLVVGTLSLYLIFFRGIKERLSILARPFLSNTIFAVIPCYAGLLSRQVALPQVFLAGFVWLGAVAHEWAHNVHGPEEVDLGLAGYADTLGPRRSAIVALATFAGAACFAGLAWLTMGRPQVFGILCTLTSVQVGFMGVRLIGKPEYKYAKPFYVAGFTFFLLPLAGLLMDGLLGQIVLPQ